MNGKKTRGMIKRREIKKSHAKLPNLGWDETKQRASSACALRQRVSLKLSKQPERLKHKNLGHRPRYAENDIAG